MSEPGPTFDNVTYTALKPLTAGLSGICIALVLVGIYYYDGTTPSAIVLGTDVASALFFLILFASIDRFVKPGDANAWGYTIGVIALANALLSFYVERTPFILSYIPIIVLGYGAFLLSLRWLTISLTTVVVTTGAVAYAVLPLDDYLLYAPIMLAACLFAFLTVLVRRSGFASAHEATLAAQAEARQRQAVEEQLAQSQRLDSLGRLVSGVAHDFNNLMMVVIGYSDTLLETHPKGATRDGLKQIRKAGDSAAQLASKLLAFSRQQVLQTQVIPANDVVENARGLILKSLPPGVQMHLNLQPDSGHIKVDPTQMEQVLLNLALNARDAMETKGGGVLTITTRPGTLSLGEEDSVEKMVTVIEVADTGVGMSEDVQDRAFEPFFTTKAQDRGTGLGLASVHGIVKQSGGHIAIESQPGVGTTFRIELPRQQQARVQEAEPAQNNMEGAAVLIVDDEEELRNLIASTLEDQGCSVITAGSGAEALQRIAASRIDVVITDIVMPEMSGMDLADELERRGYERPVIFMSGNAAHVASHAPGAVSKYPFISKPFRRHELVQLLQTVLTERSNVAA